ncbi:MAG: hypothetical protein IPJ41_07240 [Phycisphaerales bacterium]|nr:hypothetical protein [Phycisphaerales bacterium]
MPTADQLGSCPRPVPSARPSTTAHQLNGALYLVLIVLAWGWARMHRAARPG